MSINAVKLLRILTKGTETLESVSELIGLIGREELSNLRNGLGQTPLHLCALQRDREHAFVMNALVLGGCDINALDRNKNTPLHLCLKHLNLSRNPLAKYLLEQGTMIIINSEGDNQLHLALKNDHKEIAKLIIYNDAYLSDGDSEGLTALHYCCKLGDKELVNLLLQSKGCDMNARDIKNRTPLMLALENKQDEIALLLIESKAECSCFDIRMCNTLHYAIRGGNVAVAYLLIEANAVHINQQENENMFTPLHLSLFMNTVEISLKLLHSRLCDVSLKDKYGRLPMHYACTSEQAILLPEAQIHALDKKCHSPLHTVRTLEMAQFLTSRGLSVDAPNKSGSTPIHLSIFNGSVKIAIFLLGLTNQINMKDRNQSSYIHYASREGMLEVVKGIALHKSGTSDLNILDQNGNSALHLALKNEKMEVAFFLIQCGVRNNIKNHLGQDPVYFVKQLQAKGRSKKDIDALVEALL
jgi:ankyrin repeat protein